MPGKWTPEQRAKFEATLAAKKATRDADNSPAAPSKPLRATTRRAIARTPAKPVSVRAGDVKNGVPRLAFTLHGQDLSLPFEDARELYRILGTIFGSQKGKGPTRG